MKNYLNLSIQEIGIIKYFFINTIRNKRDNYTLRLKQQKKFNLVSCKVYSLIYNFKPVTTTQRQN